MVKRWWDRFMCPNGVRRTPDPERESPASDGSRATASEDKELAAARLAVEAGWKQIASSQQALEGMRGRSMALLSVMVVAASIIVGASISDQTSASSQAESLSRLGWAGIVLFAAYVLVTTVAVIHVAAPTSLLASDLLLMLGGAQALGSATHVYENYVHDLTEQLGEWRATIDSRARSLTIGLGAAPVGIVGFVLMWVHGP